MKRWAIRHVALLLYRPAWLIATVVLTVADLLPVRNRSAYAYNPACLCDFCVNDGRNPNPLMVAQGGSYGYTEPHNPPGSSAPWANAPDRRA